MIRKSRIKVVVVIPCYKVSTKIVSVLSEIPKLVTKIIVVDDKCPENSGRIARTAKVSSPLTILMNKDNLGVGGATKVGYLAAMKINPDVVIKIDGDGQMSLQDIDKFIYAIVEQKFDYAKGNRFFDIGNVREMPLIRKIGNLGLSFMSKLSTGYYEIFDPNNGFTAISGNCLSRLRLDRINNRFFFESDMLFHLNLLGAKVIDIPVPTIYGDEKSNLKVWNSLFSFTSNHLINFLRRIFYKYFLRDFNIASIQLLIGTTLLSWGSILGITTWQTNMINKIATPTGTIVLVSILIISGLQLILSFLNFDMRSQKRD